MKKHMARILLCSVLCLLVLLSQTGWAEEADQWICPECGALQNATDFCVGCSAPRPAASYLNASISGDPERTQVSILRIDGSSFISTKKDQYLYAPWNATDINKDTCWQFSAQKGLKDKAWLAMELEDETIDEIWVRNGFLSVDSKGNSLYADYSRIKDIRVEFAVFEQGTETMRFTLSDDNGNGWQIIKTGRHEHVCDVKIYVDSIYKGKKKADTVCLTDIMLVRKNTADTDEQSFEAASATAAVKVIKYGDRGSNVKHLQQMLRTLGFMDGKADGIYGQQTQDAVDYFLLYSADGEMEETADNPEDDNGVDQESIDLLERIINITNGICTDEITDEDKELWPVCQPGEDGNELCWRHMRTIKALSMVGGGYPPPEMEILLLRRARQNWIDDMRQLYDEWAFTNPKVAKAQKKSFEATVSRLEKQWKTAEKKLKGEDLIEYLWEQYYYMENMGVSLCFDLYTAEGN